MSSDTVREPSKRDTTVREPASQNNAGDTLRENVATTREGSATVRENFENPRDATAPTVREPGATARETSATLRETDSSTHVAHHQGPRVNLPEEVSRDYEWVQDLDVASGEADVSIIRDRNNGDLRFFKHYHRGIYPDSGVMSVIQGTGNRDHVVDIIRYSGDPRDAWEIQEYCPLGTIGRGSWAEAHSYPYDSTTIVEILTETSTAIHHIHHVGDGVAHRDIKPSNILIRAENPLDLVLTDFGVARDNQAGTHRTTFAGTNLYAAPEAHEGNSSKESDWFALGAIIFELLTNTKLLASKGNSDPSPKEAEVNCLQRTYYDNVVEDAIPDKRWRTLVQGLVTADRNYRWGYLEIERWLKGESPEVYWARIQGSFTGISPEMCYQPPWSNELLADPRQLARSIGEHWEEAKKGLAGRETSRISNFLSNFQGTESAIDLLNGRDSIERKLLVLQLLLDEKNVPRFDGHSLDTASVRNQISAADNGDAAASLWLLGLVRCDALIAYGERNEDRLSASAGQKLKRWYNQAESVKKSVPEKTHDLADKAFLDALPELFTLAFDSQ